MAKPRKPFLAVTSHALIEGLYDKNEALAIQLDKLEKQVLRLQGTIHKLREERKALRLHNAQLIRKKGKF